MNGNHGEKNEKQGYNLKNLLNTVFWYFMSGALIYQALKIPGKNGKEA
jgi:hypothetical protein